MFRRQRGKRAEPVWKKLQTTPKVHSNYTTLLLFCFVQRSVQHEDILLTLSVELLSFRVGDDDY